MAKGRPRGTIITSYLYGVCFQPSVEVHITSSALSMKSRCLQAPKGALYNNTVDPQQATSLQ